MPCLSLVQDTIPTLGLLPPPPALASVPLIPSSPGATTVSWSLPQPASVPWTAAPSLFAPLAQATNQTGQVIPQQAGPYIMPGFSLSPATEPFPQRLVDKVRAGQFVEMRELLTDNISLLQQLETFNTQYTLPALPGALRPRLREVMSLPSWVYCFLAYIAMRSADQATRDMLAYARLIIREAQRHGGNGWLDYDRVFRQQAAIDHTLRWNTLQPSIQAATLVGHAPGRGTFCTLCREPDHMADRCALSYLRQPHGQTPQTASGPTIPSSARPRFQPRRRPESHTGICISWNKGQCAYPGRCTFRHVCATCNRQHMACHCTETPANSPYRSNTLGGRQSIHFPTTGQQN